MFPLPMDSAAGSRGPSQGQQPGVQRGVLQGRVLFSTKVKEPTLFQVHQLCRAIAASSKRTCMTDARLGKVPSRSHSGSCVDTRLTLRILPSCRDLCQEIRRADSKERAA